MNIKDKWVNRMILGDSLVVMNSLLHYESLGGQVQMVYIDPPYGVNLDRTSSLLCASEMWGTVTTKT